MRLILQSKDPINMKTLKAMEEEIAQKLDCRVVIIQPWFKVMILPETINKAIKCIGCGHRAIKYKCISCGHVCIGKSADGVPCEICGVYRNPFSYSDGV